MLLTNERTGVKLKHLRRGCNNEIKKKESRKLRKKERKKERRKEGKKETKKGKTSEPENAPPQ